MNATFGGYKLENLGQLNVVLGKNGCGKSTLLRTISDEVRRGKAYVRYVTPERGGDLRIDGSVETNRQSPNWMYNERNRNRSDHFRQLCASEFKQLEVLVLRKIANDKDTRRSDFKFEEVVAQINSLLDHVKIKVADVHAFDVMQADGKRREEIQTLSSGESELISLGIEILSFAYTIDQDRYRGQDNWLLLDEPDVHLHPDLQNRLMKLLVDVLEGKPGRVMIATHSTPIVSSVSDVKEAAICLMKSGDRRLVFRSVDEPLREILPIFGAHPLSNVFVDRPILLVEGEDDERIWQQAVRSSRNAIRVWPCVAGDIDRLAHYEEQTRSVIEAVYDRATAFSLRDRDEADYDIDDLGPVVRMRLNCKAAENLLVSDDVLDRLGTDWKRTTEGLEAWAKANPRHKQALAVERLRAGGWDRRNGDFKHVRNLIMTIADSNKPWEVAVGQSIADLKAGKGRSGEHSLGDYLGPKLVKALDLAPAREAAVAAE